MRNRFDRQLQVLNDELIEMGSLIEQAIEMACSALVRQDVEKAQKAISFDEEIDHQERDILHEIIIAAAAGGKRSPPDLSSTENDHGYGAYRGSCIRYFGNDDTDGGRRL